MKNYLIDANNRYKCNKNRVPIFHLFIKNNNGTFRFAASVIISLRVVFSIWRTPRINDWADYDISSYSTGIYSITLANYNGYYDMSRL